MDAAGDFVVAWTGFEMGGIYADRYDSGGSLQQGYFQVQAPASIFNAQGDPSVAMDAAGDFVITWYSVGEIGVSGPNIYGQVFNADGSPHGGEFLAIAAGGSSAVAMDATGDFVVVSSNGNIDAQRFQGNLNSPTGPVVPVGSEFQVNTYTTGNQNQPKVAMDAAGDYVVVWQGDSSYSGTGEQGSGYGVYAQRDSAAGAALGSPIVVSTTGQSPAVAMDPAGDFVVVWQAPYGDNPAKLYAQRYSAAGTAEGTAFIVDPIKDMQFFVLQTEPSVAMDAAGDFVVTWEADGTFGETQSIYAQRYNSTGAVQGSDFLVDTVPDSQTVAESVQSDPEVAMDAVGDFVVTWGGFDRGASRTYGIYAQRYNAAGVTQGSEFQVDASTTGIQVSPVTAMDGAGDFVITWSIEVDGSSDGVFAQRYNAAGAAQGSEFQVYSYTSSQQAAPTVAMDSAGDFVVAWQSSAEDGSDYGVFAQRDNLSGAPEGSNFQVNTYTTGAQKLPAAAMDSEGDIVVAWESFGQDGSGYGVYAKRYAFQQETILPVLQQGTTLPITSPILQPGNTSPVFLQGSTLTIDGSTLNGPLELEFTSPTDFNFTFNGTTYSYDTSIVSHVIFNGLEGAASEVVFYDPFANDAYAATQSFSATTLVRTDGGAFEFDANNVATFYAYVSGSNSAATVSVVGGSGANFYVEAAGSGYSYIADPVDGIYSELSGFGPETVTGSGDSTYAYVYSTSGAFFDGGAGASSFGLAPPTLTFDINGIVRSLRLRKRCSTALR